MEGAQLETSRVGSAETTAGDDGAGPSGAAEGFVNEGAQACVKLGLALLFLVCSLSRPTI